VTQATIPPCKREALYVWEMTCGEEGYVTPYAIFCNLKGKAFLMAKAGLKPQMTGFPKIWRDCDGFHADWTGVQEKVRREDPPKDKPFRLKSVLGLSCD
jgi:hypothetical protein